MLIFVSYVFVCAMVHVQHPTIRAESALRVTTATHESLFSAIEEIVPCNTRRATEVTRLITRLSYAFRIPLQTLIKRILVRVLWFHQSE